MLRNKIGSSCGIKADEFCSWTHLVSSTQPRPKTTCCSGHSKHFFSSFRCDLKPPAKFWNPKITSSMRKVTRAEERKKKCR